MGVRTEDVVDELGADADADATALALGELVRAAYLEETMGADQLPGPAQCRLTEKGLQVTAGWPSSSGEVALERLLAVINERIDSAGTPDERLKWERIHSPLGSKREAGRPNRRLLGAIPHRHGRRVVPEA